ncbi:MAG: rod shape-determining protein MreC [Sphingomonas sp.]
MARPAKRRSAGQSRRLQYGLFLSYVIAVVGIVIAIFMLVLARVDPRGFEAVKGAALDATTPVSSAGRGIVRFFGGIGEGISNYFRAGSQNAALHAELAAARRALIAAQAVQAENRRLNALLGLARNTADEIVVARLVGSSFEAPRRLATLAAGRSSGVAVGQPVRAPEGLVGRVIETGRWASRVLLITDGGSNVPVRLVRNGTPAIAVGRGDGSLDLRTLEVGQNPFRPGDILITSGVGGIFPPGIPVAMVTRLDGDSAIANPIADPARADFAIVQPIAQPAAIGPLDQAVAPAAGPPIAGPPPTPGAGSGQRQNDPRYQPALQARQGQPPVGATR